jgi:hypothetical protein
MSHNIFANEAIRVIVRWEAAGMTAEKKAARHRQWAANAIAEAMRMESEADRETLMMIARQHLAMAQKAERSASVSPSPNCHSTILDIDHD